MIFPPGYKETMVEAIDEGRIVKVPEIYAKREGLPIIRRPQQDIQEEVQDLPPSHFAPKKKEDLLKHDNFHKPDWRSSQVLSELKDNFHWLIRLERRKKGITRKQLSKLINEPEENLQTIESGKLPIKDFVLINKIQQALHINLRKDNRDFSKSLQDIMPSHKNLDVPKPKHLSPDSDDQIQGSEIEILEDEI